MWFANGIHHHYSNDKFRPEFAEKWLREQIDRYVYSDDLDIPVDFLCAILYDPDMYPSRMNQTAGADVILTSANNYYEGVDQQQVEEFYARMAEQHKDDKEPISYGLNSKLMADEEGNVVERVWRVGGMYSPAIEKIVYWLDKAAEVAEPVQRRTIEALAKYYRTGDLKDFDAYNILWVKDLESNVDFVNGFIEDYGDPLGRKASWEANVNFRDEQACRRTEIISANAQWFEDNSPVDPAYKKKTVKGRIGQGHYRGYARRRLLSRNADRHQPAQRRLDPQGIRLEVGNYRQHHLRIRQGRPRQRFHEGVRSATRRPRTHGQIRQAGRRPAHRPARVPGSRLGTAGARHQGHRATHLHLDVEEARADLFGLYYLGDEKLVELGLIPSLDVAWAQYADYIMNGMMTQLSRIEPGKNVEESHMRNRKAHRRVVL